MCSVILSGFLHVFEDVELGPFQAHVRLCAFVQIFGRLQFGQVEPKMVFVLQT